MLIATLFTVAKKWNNLTAYWQVMNYQGKRKEKWYLHTVEYNSAFKKKEILVGHDSSGRAPA
jgi:hypothetical protein